MFEVGSLLVGVFILKNCLLVLELLSQLKRKIGSYMLMWDFRVWKYRNIRSWGILRIGYLDYVVFMSQFEVVLFFCFVAVFLFKFKSDFFVGIMRFEFWLSH